MCEALASTEVAYVPVWELLVALVAHLAVYRGVAIASGDCLREDVALVRDGWVLVAEWLAMHPM